VIVFILEWRGISYFEKRRGIVGAFFSRHFQGNQGSEEAVVTTVRGGPHSPAVAARLCLA